MVIEMKPPLLNNILMKLNHSLKDVINILKTSDKVGYSN